MIEQILSNDEVNQVIQILSQIDAFSEDSRSRRDFIDAAGLGKYTAGIDWCADAETIAARLVSSLNAAGPLVENPNYHAVGKLLVYILSWPTITRENAHAVAMLIVRRSLVDDPDYLEKLREKFDIGDQLPKGVSYPAAHLALLPLVQPPPFTVKPEIHDRAALERLLSEMERSIEIQMMAGALYCAQAVGRVEAPANNVLGTGWLIAPNLLLTNFHVLQSREVAEEGVVRFGHCLDMYGVQTPGECTVKIDPSFYYTSPVELLDYALVRLSRRPLETKMLLGGVGSLTMLDLLRQNKHRGYLVASRQNVVHHTQASLIQYSAGDDLQEIMTHSLFAADAAEHRLHYFADTMPGSSGSPVFNRFWEVVAMHHSSGPGLDGQETVEQIAGRRAHLNEGIPLKAILDDFKKRTIDNTSIPLIALIPEAR